MQDLLSVYFVSFMHKIQPPIFGIKKLHVKLQVLVIDIPALISWTSKFDSLLEREVTESF
jgi:hypothetical protein